MICDLLRESNTSLSYAAWLAVQKLRPDDFILETQDGNFGWQRFAAAGLCQAVPVEGVACETNESWDASENHATRIIVNGYLRVAWQGHTLHLLQLQRESASCGTMLHQYVVAASAAIAQEFFAAVCRWNSTIREEVLVFQQGHWDKDQELFQSIQQSRLDSLILPPGLKETIHADAAGFFQSRERYRRFNIPWKRGLILLGPPGNGKTHMIQGLINELKHPCLYVRSLKARYQNEDYSIHQVFERARAAAPCVLVLEDIDALITAETRSYFLNELDGFRKNEGLLVIATTNHPERLDPAIVDRPSRFDRKYHFDLPALPERRAYLTWWNGQLEAELRLSAPGLHAAADATDGFSFAYLKELAMAATMGWFNQPGAGMDAVVVEQARFLRTQMTTTTGAAS